MVRYLAKPTLATAGWMLAGTLMVVATLDQTAFLRGWSLFAAMVAWIPTHALIVCEATTMEREKTQQTMHEEALRTEALIQAVAVQFASRDVPRINPDRTSS